MCVQLMLTDIPQGCYFSNDAQHALAVNST
jgi:hypothetical protein